MFSIYWLSLEGKLSRGFGNEQMFPERKIKSTEVCSLIEQNPINETQKFISPLTFVSL